MVGTSPSAPPSVRYRIGQSEAKVIPWVRGVVVMATVVVLVMAVIGHQPRGLYLGYGFLLATNAGAWIYSRMHVVVDVEGVHFPFRLVPWQQVESVRSSSWDDCVVLVMEGGKERRLGLPAASGQQVAELGSRPYRSKR